jgi:hypothetical protein
MYQVNERPRIIMLIIGLIVWCGLVAMYFAGAFPQDSIWSRVILAAMTVSLTWEIIALYRSRLRGAK